LNDLEFGFVSEIDKGDQRFVVKVEIGGDKVE